MRVARLLSVKHWLLFVALAGMYVVANSAGAEAVCLTTSWQFPEQACGSRATWTVTELCSTNTSSCMKGAVNEVLIYVPNDQQKTTECDGKTITQEKSVV